MDREEIFRLLMIILLLSNNADLGSDNNTDEHFNRCNNSPLGNINAVIIILLLINSNFDNSSDNDADNSSF